MINELRKQLANESAGSSSDKISSKPAENSFPILELSLKGTTFHTTAFSRGFAASIKYL